MRSAVHESLQINLLKHSVLLFPETLTAVIYAVVSSLRDQEISRLGNISFSVKLA